MDVFEDQPTQRSAGHWTNLGREMYLVIDQTPLLEERVNSHNCANITRQISPAGSNGKIFHWVQPVGIDHKISVVLVHSWCLAAIAVIEEFW